MAIAVTDLALSPETCHHGIGRRWNSGNVAAMLPPLEYPSYKWNASASLIAGTDSIPEKRSHNTHFRASASLIAGTDSIPEKRSNNTDFREATDYCNHYSSRQIALVLQASHPLILF